MSGTGQQPTRGRFITFEGGEGAGKSTQARRLALALGAVGLPVVETREPLSPDIRALLVEGATDRWLPRTEALLHTAARVEHVERQILPALADGHWVVCDRFADSTRAYQGVVEGVGLETVDELQRWAIGDLAPDLTFVLDLDPAEGLRRASGRTHAEDRYERMGLAFHETLRRAFRRIAEREPERCVVLDAAAPVETLAAAIAAETARRFALSLKA
ncbi:dTMP kinase [Zavarzinia sp. CC-PAN008]|uniref:dTMP kinase n=1 Tax=Zavarzinia sp. CC-PAN008 TaxID=3243332 RepID=UPI003F744440